MLLGPKTPFSPYALYNDHVYMHTIFWLLTVVFKFSGKAVTHLKTALL